MPTKMGQKNADTRKERNPLYRRNVCAIHIFALFAFFNYLWIYLWRK